MAQLSLGLDIGEVSVKAILIKSTLWGQLEVLESQDIVVGETGLEGALQKCKEKFPSYDEISISLDRRDIAQRIIQLPATNKKTIRKLAPFQMEGKLPFKGEALFDGCSLRQQKEGQSPTLLCAIERERFLQREKLVEDVFGKKPKFHQVDTMAAASVFLHEESHSGFEILADVGSKKTTITLFQDGQLKVSRLLLYALQTRRQQKFAKDDEGEKLAKRLSTEVKRLLLSNGADISQLSRVVLCGGGALRVTFAALLSEELSCPVTPLKSALLGQRGAHYTTALGVALSPFVNLPLAVDFLAHEKPHPLLSRKNVAAVAVGLVSLALVQVLSLALTQSSLGSKLEKQAQIIASLEDITSKGALKPQRGANYKAVIKRIKERIELLERSKLSPVRTLYEVTRCLPNRSVVLTNLKIQPDSVQVEAEADSFSTADKMKKGIQSSPHFNSPAYGSTSHLKRGPKRVLRFQLSFGREIDSAIGSS